MRFVMFYHSLVSDWNHGNAHFLRGVASELQARGHEIAIYEPQDGWSYANLVSEHGEGVLADFARIYPQLASTRYELSALNLDAAFDGADVVIVHEWNSRALIEAVGRHRETKGRYQLFFHDTHHRSVTEPGSLGVEHLPAFDGVLAFGESVRSMYVERGWASRAWVWHEAADTRVFHPCAQARGGDLAWIGNWGDGERTIELQDYVFGPIRELRLRATVHGVRYPEEAIAELARCGASYGGWIPNFRVPEVFARHAVTVHVPRKPYREHLRGVPTIRVFEALACGIPLVCAPWDDCEKLFTPGKDYLVARDGAEMIELLREILANAELRRELSAHGLKTIRARHSCAHRVDELLEIVQ